jgi:hypothetical protein
MDNPWKEIVEKIKIGDNEFILTNDSEYIKNHNKKYPDNNKFHIYTHRIPIPFKGNPNSPIILLSKNPGFEREEDDIHKRANYKVIKIKNLLHQPQEYSFYSLNPILSEYSSYKYWYKRLRTLIDISSQQKVAENVFCVEYFPYCSKAFNFDKLWIPSQKYSFYLVEQAIKRDSMIVIMRAQKLWYTAIPALEKYDNKFSLKSPRSSYITINNYGNEYYSKLAELIKKQ